jgi:hypothetical protein
VFLDKSDFVDIRYSIDQESILLWEQQRFVAPNDIKSYIGWLNEDAKQKNVTPAKISVGLM